MADSPDDLLLTPSENSFEYFCKLVLRTKLGDMHRKWIEAVLGKKHVCIMSARGHFKTTIMSIAFPLWIMFKEKKPKLILIISASLEQSTEIMNNIKRQIEDNPLLRERLYPDNVYQTKWSETQIRTKNGHRILCLPFGDSVRGKHCDYCISDDILKAEVRSDIEDSKRIFYGIIFPTTYAKSGKHIVVGTPVAYTDLLHDLAQKDSFVFQKYPAVILNDDGTWKSPQFPEHFTFEMLKEIKETMPSHLWAREYLCTPISEDSSMYPPEVIKRSIDLHHKLKVAYDTKDIKPTWYLGCDISVSASERADWSVFTVLGKLPGMPLFVKDIVRKHLDTEGNYKEIIDLHAAYGFSKILIEKNGVGWASAMKCVDSDVIKGISVAFDTKHSSREKILSRLEIKMRNNELAIPDNSILLEELSTIGYKKGKDGIVTYASYGKHDDCVMSLALALEAAGTAVPITLTLI